MAKITVQFEDGEPHVYTGVPDSVTPDQITERVIKDFPDRAVKHLAREAEKTRAEIPGQDPSIQAPKAVPKKQSLDSQIMRGIDTAFPGRKLLTDTAKNTIRAAGQGVLALGQMVEEPAAQLLGAPRSAARLSEGLQNWTADTSEPSKVAGDTLAQLLPAKKITEALPIARTAIERVGKTAATGGLVTAASTPVEGGKDFVENKARQTGEGAAAAGVFAGAGETAKGVGRFAKDHVFGPQYEKAKELWGRAKDLGFSIRPEQTRADAAAVSQAGLSLRDKIQNKAAANRMVSEKVGDVTSGDINTEYFDRNFKELGSKYDSVYSPGTRLKVDQQNIDNLKDIVEYEQAKGHPFMSRKAVAAANRLITEWETLQGSTGKARLTKIAVPADMLKDVRDSLQHSAKTSSDLSSKSRMYEVIEEFDNAVQRNHPQFRALLDEINPKYRALSTLDEGTRAGFVDRGSVDLEGLARHLQNKEARHYTRGISNHPLYEAAQIGETFGIRGMSKPAVTGDSRSRAGTGEEQFVPTRYGIWKSVRQHGMRLPGVRTAHERYLLEGFNPDVDNPIPMAVAASESDREFRDRLKK